MRAVTLRIPDATFERLLAAAEEAGTNPSDYARKAVTESLERADRDARILQEIANARDTIIRELQKFESVDATAPAVTPKVATAPAATPKMAGAK